MQKIVWLVALSLLVLGCTQSSGTPSDATTSGGNTPLSVNAIQFDSTAGGFTEPRIDYPFIAAKEVIFDKMSDSWVVAYNIDTGKSIRIPKEDFARLGKFAIAKQFVVVNSISSGAHKLILYNLGDGSTSDLEQPDDSVLDLAAQGNTLFTLGIKNGQGNLSAHVNVYDLASRKKINTWTAPNPFIAPYVLNDDKVYYVNRKGSVISQVMELDLKTGNSRTLVDDETEKAGLTANRNRIAWLEVRGSNCTIRLQNDQLAQDCPPGINNVIVIKDLHTLQTQFEIPDKGMRKLTLTDRGAYWDESNPKGALSYLDFDSGKTSSIKLAAGDVAFPDSSNGYVVADDLTKGIFEGQVVYFKHP